ncbi:MAG TPA: M13 family metallopeptidase [Chiayiivirga sp.]|nr:M13 family metallopeptidase [Chiayiivirga sp.]
MQRLTLPLAFALSSMTGLVSALPSSQAIDPRQLDTSTPACTDFYQHANGGWLKTNPIPTGFASWGTFEEMAQQGLLQQRALLEAAIDSEDATTRLLGNLYASGMDEAAVEAAAATALRPLLDRIERIRKPRDTAAAIAELHARGIPVLFDFGAGDDLANPARRIAYANQGGLGLSDRDYYLRDDADTALLLAAYEAYIERLLTLTGSAHAANEADWVMQVEKRIARASLSLMQLRDPQASYAMTEVKALAKTYPALNWKKFLKAQGLVEVDTLSLAHTAFFREADSLVQTLPPEQWRAYLRFHVAHAMAPYLSRGFVDAHDALYLRTLRGSQEPMPRWRRVLASVDTLLGPALGQRYLDVHFPQATRQAAEALTERVRTTLREQLAHATWLGTLARQTALEKLDAVDIKLGGPDQIPGFDGLQLSANDYAGNVLKLVGWWHQRYMASIDKVREEWQWAQAPYAVNVYYDAARNQLVVPAGLMQAPLFDPAGDAAANFGGLGSVLAHELFRGFDSIGSRFDAQGRLAPWWQEADARAFALRFKPLEAQYSAYPSLGSVKVNGAIALSENIADLAAVEISHAAFAQTEDRSQQGTLSAEQRFFHAYARLWRRNYRDEELQLLARIDVHAPAKWRVNGPLANSTAFATAFRCKVDAKSMMRPLDARTTVF